jgi:enterochelin esterase family protein
VKLRRRVVVYVPPGYDAEPGRRFPVLYLRHGNGDLESTWSDVGRAGDILDNLLAQQKAVPMLIAMPNGYPSASGAGNSDEGLTVTDLEVIREIIPFIERNYRVSASQESRAIAGLSMGATQALLTGLQHLDTFAWVAAFSSGTVGDADFKLETAVPGFLGESNGPEESSIVVPELWNRRSSLRRPSGPRRYTQGPEHFARVVQHARRPRMEGVASLSR